MTPKQNLARPWPAAMALVLAGITTAMAALWADFPAPAATAEPHSFTHPGGVVGKAELDFVRAKLAAGEEPWTSALG